MRLEKAPGSPEDWLNHAKSDLTLAQSKQPSAVFLETLCFHAQQAVEKSLKALLVHYKIAFPKTHNIGTLIELLPETILVPKDVQDSTILTDYAVSARYPGVIEPVTDSEHNQAIQMAENVMLWAEKVIKS